MNIKKLLKEKTKDYGDAVTSMTWCGAFWTLALQRAGKLKEGKIIEPDLACELMLLFKISRDLGNPRQDNILDIAGYAEIVAKERGYK